MNTPKGKSMYVPGPLVALVENMVANYRANQVAISREAAEEAIAQLKPDSQGVAA